MIQLIGSRSLYSGNSRENLLLILADTKRDQTVRIEREGFPSQFVWESGWNVDPNRVWPTMTEDADALWYLVIEPFLNPHRCDGIPTRGFDHRHRP